MICSSWFALLVFRDTADDELFPTLGRRVADDERQVLEQLSTKQLCGLIYLNLLCPSQPADCASVLPARSLLPHSVRALDMQPQESARRWDQRRGDRGGKRCSRPEVCLHRAAARRMSRSFYVAMVKTSTLGYRQIQRVVWNIHFWLIFRCTFRHIVHPPSRPRHSWPQWFHAHPSSPSTHRAYCVLCQTPGLA